MFYCEIVSKFVRLRIPKCDFQSDAINFSFNLNKRKTGKDRIIFPLIPIKWRKRTVLWKNENETLRIKTVSKAGSTAFAVLEVRTGSRPRF